MPTKTAMPSHTPCVARHAQPGTASHAASPCGVCTAHGDTVPVHARVSASHTQPACAASVQRVWFAPASAHTTLGVPAHSSPARTVTAAAHSTATASATASLLRIIAEREREREKEKKNHAISHSLTKKEGEKKLWLIHDRSEKKERKEKKTRERREIHQTSWRSATSGTWSEGKRALGKGRKRTPSLAMGTTSRTWMGRMDSGVAQM